MDICVDFDGTIVTHEYPFIGCPNPKAIEVLTLLQEKGHRLILFTIRSGKRLQEAVDYVTGEGIKLHGVNHNPDQMAWTSSPKAYGQIYIDDAALGCPLKFDPTLSSRTFVDWDKVYELLKKEGAL